jgi:hypothetical protein
METMRGIMSKCSWQSIISIDMYRKTLDRKQVCDCHVVMTGAQSPALEAPLCPSQARSAPVQLEALNKRRRWPLAGLQQVSSLSGPSLAIRLQL